MSDRTEDERRALVHQITATIFGFNELATRAGLVSKFAVALAFEPCPLSPSGEHDWVRCDPECCDEFSCMCAALFGHVTEAEWSDELRARGYDQAAIEARLRCSAKALNEGGKR